MAVEHRDVEAVDVADAGDVRWRVSDFGTCVWTEMRGRSILPTPQAYAVWFTYRLGSNPALTKRLDDLVEQRAVLTPAVMLALHNEFVVSADSDADMMVVGDGVAELGEISEELTAQIVGEQAALADYGASLNGWAQRIGSEPTVGALITAVSTLTAETTRAATRNRELEQKLAASVGRINQLRRSLNTVKQEATTDQLTGIANRRAFEARLRRAVAQARSEPSSPMSVLLLDVDHFKRFNDTYGHKTGDLVLRLVARLLSDNVKGRDLVARYGGEEFAIILAGADLVAAGVVGRQIGEALSVKRLGSKGLHSPIGQVTISVGASQFRAGDSPASLVARADEALYLAKSRGRNQVCVQTG